MINLKDPLLKLDTPFLQLKKEHYDGFHTLVADALFKKPNDRKIMGEIDKKVKRNKVSIGTELFHGTQISTAEELYVMYCCGYSLEYAISRVRDSSFLDWKNND